MKSYKNKTKIILARILYKSQKSEFHFSKERNKKQKQSTNRSIERVKLFHFFSTKMNEIKIKK